jgi:hypothetical protein
MRRESQQGGDLVRYFLFRALLLRHRSWRYFDGAIQIGRGNKWDNSFRIGVDGDRATVIAKHARWLRDQHHLLRTLDELRGKDLFCFRAPSQCHGGLSLRLANATTEKRVDWWRSAA